MGTFTDAVDVAASEQGTPVEVSWRGVRYTVAEHPLCWYQRRPWWTQETRLPPGAGVGIVDTQIWRLVLLAEDSPNRFTLDVAHYRPAGRWRVIKIYDAADQSAPGRERHHA